MEKKFVPSEGDMRYEFSKGEKAQFKNIIFLDKIKQSEWKIERVSEVIKQRWEKRL
jgi:hypothetical protein